MLPARNPLKGPCAMKRFGLLGQLLLHDDPGARGFGQEVTGCRFVEVPTGNKRRRRRQELLDIVVAVFVRYLRGIRDHNRSGTRRWTFLFTLCFFALPFWQITIRTEATSFKNSRWPAMETCCF